MGEEQRLGRTRRCSRGPRGVRRGPDFTVAVEEEFALLDPETLGLVNRFEELRRPRRAPSSSRTSSAS